MVKSPRAYRYIGLTALFAVLLGTLPVAAYTQEEDTAPGGSPEESQTVEAPAPKEEPLQVQMDKLLRLIAENPENMDLNYKYATLATKLEMYDEAIAAYDRMLMANPKLSRVRLDMGLAYMKAGQTAEAEKQFRTVLAENPPEPVRKNIEAMLARIAEGQKRHKVGGSVAIGFAEDSNANSSPDSGNVSVFDIVVPLGSGNGNKRDRNVFTSASLNHTYLFDSKTPNVKHAWESGISAYRTWQNSLESLDLQVLSLKTGPVFNVPKIRSRIGGSLMYSVVDLNSEKYLENRAGLAFIETMISPRVRVNFSAKREYRAFYNTPTNITYEDRNGHTNDFSVGLTAVGPTTNDIFNVGLSLRDEFTEVKYYDNHQKSVTLGYTRILPYDMFANASLLFKHSNYKGVDPLVSPTTIRKDNEKTLTLLLGKKLNKNWVMTGSFQRRDIDSSLLNYEYENKRWLVSLAYQF